MHIIALLLALVAPSFVTPQVVHWVPGTGALAGSESAVIQGDPTKPGIYVLRYKFPDGFAIAPHVHTQSENVDVLQGTLLVGIGDAVQPYAMHAMIAGSFFSIPARTAHYAKARGETIIDVRAMGPRVTTPVKRR